MPDDLTKAITPHGCGLVDHDLRKVRKPLARLDASATRSKGASFRVLVMLRKQLSHAPYNRTVWLHVGAGARGHWLHAS